jgi:hypothetical protein
MKRQNLRHFPYQHPTFGTEKKPKPKRYWEDTIYFVWWSYLKRSKDYLLTCESNGEKGLVDLYNDFGDVRGDNFKVWWSKDSRGMRLFAEPQVLSSVQIVTSEDLKDDLGDTLLVAIPLTLPKKFLLERLRKLIAEHHKGERGRQYAKLSKAKYQFKGQPNIKGLKRALKVYDHLEELKVQGLTKPLWKVAMDLDIVEDEFRVQSTDTPKTAEDKRRRLTAIVGRLKKKAADSIQNTGQGMFP